MTVAESHRVTTERPNLECDVIMKGGITSGVVYPGAIFELSRTYRFRGIGGKGDVRDDQVDARRQPLSLAAGAELSCGRCYLPDGPLQGSQLEPVAHATPFWFAWAAFNPDTSLYEGRG